MEIEQTPEGRLSRRFAVSVLSKSPVGVFVVSACRYLEVGDAVWVPHVCVATFAPVKITWVWQHRNQIAISRWEADFMTQLHFLEQY